MIDRVLFYANYWHFYRADVPPKGCLKHKATRNRIVLKMGITRLHLTVTIPNAAVPLTYETIIS